MESTIGMRIRQLREARQLTVADFAKAAGVKPSAVYGLESGANKPSLETVAALRQSFPGLNTEWLQFGEGEPFPDGRFSHKPAPAPRPEPAADYTSANSTEQTLYISVLKEQVADLKAQVHDLKEDKADLKAEVSELRGKSPGSSDAVGHLHTPAPAPLPTVGFRLSVQRRTNKPGMQQSR